MDKRRKQRVVVVGGGIAGVHVAKALESEASVSLIDPKDYLEIPYGALRNTVEPSFAERSIVPYSEFLTQVELVQSAAVSVSSSPAQVSTSTGRKLPYDFLVISTGSHAKGAPTRRDRIQEILADHERLKRASSILVVGGGPVGVELAGEIVTDFPEKSVSLVQGGPRLIEFLGPSASTKALNWLTSKSVRVLLKERITSSASPPIFTTESGKQIPADTHFVCTGSRPSSSWLKGTFLEDSLDGNGRLRVDSALLVSGTRNVFACGDITDLKEIKQGFLAEKHAKVVAANIRKLTNDADCGDLRCYCPLERAMGLVSLGRHAGVAQLPFGTFVGWIPGLVKSRDLFVGKTRKGLGLRS
ncbi:apoptosis-inducing factor 2-like [Selaginella moellendorffii]|uniref:apoptosis-inducing factor 2-like n=1 Tax=Selaginella moellendorffii TaxID=88036 RepID=UPI000D1C27E9|nr:apoptosis-inducing factor 2-like [Selaginella moellendorffii]|eukprot:XP_024542924.1 apoptosis-inducing factor 2-like [Selaginella moellendorffii]